MPFVARNATGCIEAVFPEQRECATEQLQADAAELQTFVSGLCQRDVAREQLSSSDGDMIRVLEDLVDVLMQKGIVAWDDFAPQAQRKLLFRKDLRWQMKHRLAS
jgi:hypothetical protein